MLRSLPPDRWPCLPHTLSGVCGVQDHRPKGQPTMRKPATVWDVLVSILVIFGIVYLVWGLSLIMIEPIR